VTALNDYSADSSDSADSSFSVTGGCGRAGSAECITKGFRCIGVVLIKIEMNVSGSSLPFTKTNRVPQIQFMEIYNP